MRPSGSSSGSSSGSCGNQPDEDSPMTAPWTPMRWPAAWTDSSALELIKGSAIDYLWIDKGEQFESVRTQARQAGLRIGVADEAPSGVMLVKGQWPGVRAARSDAGR